MIARNCQLAVVFGGNRFLFFSMIDYVHNGDIVHQLQCSPILDTIPANDNLPGAFKVTIAALLGPKNSFFRANGMAIGLAYVIPATRPPPREAAKKSKSASQSSRKGKGRGQTGQSSSGTSRVSHCCVCVALIR